MFRHHDQANLQVSPQLRVIIWMQRDKIQNCV